MFDLDPGTNNFEAVKATARSLKQLLDWLGLPAYLKTTGSRGLHVIVPLKPAETFESVRSFARSCARLVVSQAPAQSTMEQRINARGERVFVDTNRNAYAQLIAPPTPCTPVVARLSRRRLPGASLLKVIFDRTE